MGGGRRDLDIEVTANMNPELVVWHEVSVVQRQHPGLGQFTAQASHKAHTCIQDPVSSVFACEYMKAAEARLAPSLAYVVVYSRPCACRSHTRARRR